MAKSQYSVDPEAAFNPSRPMFAAPAPRVERPVMPVTDWRAGVADSGPRTKMMSAMLQVAHRGGVVALLLLVGGIAAAGGNHQSYPLLLLGAFVAFDAALLASFTAWWLGRRASSHPSDIREALGVMVFNAIGLIPATMFLVIARMHRMPAFIAWIHSWFQ